MSPEEEEKAVSKVRGQEEVEEDGKNEDGANDGKVGKIIHNLSQKNILVLSNQSL